MQSECPVSATLPVVPLGQVSDVSLCVGKTSQNVNSVEADEFHERCVETEQVVY